MPSFRRFLAAAVLSAGVAAPFIAPMGFAVADSVAPPIHSLPLISQVSQAPRRASTMAYHGGPVMVGPVNVYIVWYGDWSKAPQRQAIITDFIGNLASPYFAINGTYPDRAKATVANTVVLAGQVNDAYSVGKKNLSDERIRTVVTTALANKTLPTDPHGVYLVITSSDVNKQGFLTQYCGWHTYTKVGAKGAQTAIKYSFVGDPTGPKMRGCTPQMVSPNGDAAADAMVSVVAHEIDEAVTDPTLDGWYDARGNENADLCAWKYGTTFDVGSAKANLTLGKRSYLVQTNWVNVGKGACGLSVGG